MDVDQVGDSDSHPFVDKKVPGTDFHSIDEKSFRLLHSEKDVVCIREFSTSGWRNW